MPSGFEGTGHGRGAAGRGRERFAPRPACCRRCHPCCSWRNCCFSSTSFSCSTATSPPHPPARRRHRHQHLKNVNNLVAEFKRTRDQGIIYQGGLSLEYMYTFHDSSFKSERESGSQMGILTFLGPKISESGDIQGVSLLRWASKRARRVCHSTLAAETLASTAGLDSSVGLRFRL